MTAGWRLLISGRVQGVGYRVFAARASRVLGVRGWVRNLPDGRVEVEAAAGHPGALADFLERLRQGPAGGRVDGVKRESAPGPGSTSGFEIRG